MYRTSKNINNPNHQKAQKGIKVCYPIHQEIASYSTLIMAIIALFYCSTAWAEETDSIPPSNNNISVINSSDVSGNRGTVTVNVSAGDLNSQANVGVIAVGLDAGKNITQPIIDQKIKKIRNQTPDKAIASITGNAFSNSSGWTAVNQISGQANMQANIMVISVGGEYEVDAVGDDLLAQSFSGTSVSGSPSTNQHHERAASIDDSALRGMTGVVQVNQTAGARNATSNTFVFQITGN